MKKIQTFYSFILCFLLILSCNTTKQKYEDHVPNQIITDLHTYVKNEILDEFLSDYSEYDFAIVRKLTDRPLSITNMILFSFNSKKIDENIFLKMIEEDERVISAGFNHYYYFHEL
jgi:hypothetical protein